jgi:hypothetical protein
MGSMGGSRSCSAYRTATLYGMQATNATQKTNGSAIALPFAAFARAEDYFLPVDAGV